jgi:hypothetical protein
VRFSPPRPARSTLTPPSPVATDAGTLQSFPRMFLDPRRPTGKATAEMQEEMLVPYDALLPDDPRRVVSHRYRVRCLCLCSGDGLRVSCALIWVVFLNCYAAHCVALCALRLRGPAWGLGFFLPHLGGVCAAARGVRAAGTRRRDARCACGAHAVGIASARCWPLRHGAARTDPAARCISSMLIPHLCRHTFLPSLPRPPPRCQLDTDLGPHRAVRPHADCAPRQVAGVREILTAPALLESTSLVFAYGLDLFGTRVAPSKTFDVLSESFNKAQLALTVLGLAGAIVMTGPAVRRKRLRERWYRS